MSRERLRNEGLSEGDSDGYPADSGADSDGYQSGRGDPSARADQPHLVDKLDEDDQFDEGLHRLIEQWKGMREGWWNQASYETYWDVVKEQEAGWQRMGFRSIFDKPKKHPKSSRELPDATPADIDLETLAADATRSRRPRTRQVNVRLTELGYDALCKAARSYGLRPTTLARLLVHRGALAVLEARENGRDPGR